MPEGYHIYQNSDGYWTFYQGGFPKDLSREFMTAEQARQGSWTDWEQRQLDELNS